MGGQIQLPAFLNEDLLYAFILPLSVLCLSAIPWLVMRTVVTIAANRFYSKSEVKRIRKRSSMWGKITLFCWFENHSIHLLSRLIFYWAYCIIVFLFCILMILSALHVIHYSVLFWPYLIFKIVEFSFCAIWFWMNRV